MCSQKGGRSGGRRNRRQNHNNTRKHDANTKNKHVPSQSSTTNNDLDTKTQLLINSIKRNQLRCQEEIKSNRERHAKNTPSHMMKHRTVKQRMKDGEMDIKINVDNIMLLFLENGVKQFNGSFWNEYKIATSSMLEYLIKKTALLNNEALKYDSNDMVQLSDDQIRLFEKAQKYLEFAAKYGTKFENVDLNNWDVNQLQSYLRKENMDVKPMPNNKNILLKAVKQVLLMKEKLSIMFDTMPDDDEAVLRGRRDINNNSKRWNAIINQDYDYTDDDDTDSDEGYSDDEMETKANIETVIDSHSLLPNNLDLSKLPDWSHNKSIAQVFQSSRSQVNNGYGSLMNGLVSVFQQLYSGSANSTHANLKCNPFDEMQESFYSIAKVIDSFGVNNIGSVEPFIVQDEQEARAITIIPCFVKCLNIESQSIPVVGIKYFDAFRSRMTSEKAQGLMKEFQHNNRAKNGLRAVDAKLDEIAMMGKLLKQNRKKLNQNVLKDIEEKYISLYNIGMFKCSVFLPYCDKDKNLTKCANCGGNAVSRCSRCRKVSYCSENCQRNHWKSNHKSECGM